MSKKIIIAGGSGFLGTHLAKELREKGYDVHILSRGNARKGEIGNWVNWNPPFLDNWSACLEGAFAVVNLAGRSVDCIKTPENCDEILRSRIDSTKAIGMALHRAKQKPGVWVQMSTSHIYGDPANHICTEESSSGYGLAPAVGLAWEKEFHSSCPEGIRKVIVRTSFVLGKAGGALSRLGLLAKFGFGGKVGSGKQGISWIHEEDMSRIFVQAIENTRMNGVYNATAPNPVSNSVFMKALRGALKTPIGLPAFSWMVRIAAPVFLNTDPELALQGRYVVPRRLEESGFKFRFPSVEGALKEIYEKKRG